ncbi:DUF3047 domain-containing protein [Natronospirillum operosum]|uniref:DUF3047 domain-containing protein n=1 Tax=Natronospirillum operosum TaxID=2759953 RepID=A0A4Z0WB66_9GAMM|nr:DUF3047 domain-containing protein [Natronospirillum operosum]TGG95402.1 DUF3047 domain-containing protein [Natronospirillum operosum]
MTHQHSPRFSPQAWSLAVLLGAGALASAAPAETRVFTPQDIIEWERHSFNGETQYELVEVDGRSAVHAICTEGTASGLFLQDDIDLTATPVVEWEWRVDETFSSIDETTRAGDDYPARLYAVDEHRIRIWSTRALNYVWASEMPAGEDWPNAYQRRAHMIAMQSGPPEERGTWVTERRNLREDFRHFHDRELERLNAFAIMTDCDDVGEPIEAWYGEIRLLAE